MGNGYIVVAKDLLALYGKGFAVPVAGTKQPLKFEVPGAPQNQRFQGTEAYGVLVDCLHPARGRLRSFLKIFRYDIAERAPRTAFLINTGLARKHPWIYHGVPYAWLRRFEVAGVPIVGHVALQIGAEFGRAAKDFARSRFSWDAESMRTRKRLAGQLCVAVLGLERMEITHGDLSPGNIMIGPGPNGETTCTLCDFDGFHHPSQPLLPRTINGNPCRPLGSPGFQYKSLIDQIRRDPENKDPSIKVETDRFALAVLCCELVVWSQGLGDHLRQDTLMANASGQATSLDHLPKSTIDLWPEGFALLERALAAKTIDEMPSPESWLLALGFTGATSPLLPGSRPRIRFFRSFGNNRTRHAEANLTSDEGDFSSIDPALSAIRFQFDGQELNLEVTWTHDVFIAPPCPIQANGPGPRRLVLSLGQSIRTNGWEIEFYATRPTP
jgi:hypothetical protein